MAGFMCDIVTPKARHVSEEATLVVVPGIEGEMGFLAGHAPLVSVLADGEVRREPVLALDGGSDGLAVYRRIAPEAGAHLNPGGYLYLEVGIGEAERVLELVTAGVECAQSGILNDLNGIPRVVWARSV